MTLRKKKYLYILSTGNISGFGAANNRSRLYLEGLSKNGFDVTCFAIRPEKGYSDSEYPWLKQCYNGQIISFLSCCDISFVRALVRPFLCILAVVNVFRLIMTEQYDYIMTTRQTGLMQQFVIRLIAGLFGVRFIHELVEKPFLFRKDGVLPRLKSWFYKKHIVGKASGALVCSTALAEYVKQQNQTINLLNMPSITDTGAFLSKKRSNNKDITIFYCGDMGNNKDGVGTLVDAFLSIAGKYPQLKLLLVGAASDQDVLKGLKEKVNNTAYADRVTFTGRVAHRNVIELMGQGDIMALARPDNEQAKYGFPSKLAEYLSTEKPVIVTSVGDIPKYLTDNETAFITKPGSSMEFSRMIETVLGDWEKAEKIGVAGRELAKKHFDKDVQSKQFADWLIAL